MERNDDTTIERHLAVALRRLNDATAVPPPDPGREAALMAAFDAARGAARVPIGRGSQGRDRVYLAAFAAAAAVLIAVGVGSVPGRRGSPPAGATATHTPPVPRDVRLEPPNDFVIVPGAAGLPAIESGTLVRMDIPVAELATYGVAPPASRRSTVTADVIVAQDGLPRAVRVVAP